MSNFKTIVTIGPSILDEERLRCIDELGLCIFRINGAHTNEHQAQKIINQIRSILPNAEIMMDLPGNKVRTSNLSEPIRLVRGESFILHDYEINYSKFHALLKQGDIVHANDSVYSFEVVEIKEASIKLLSHSDGLLQSNKGLHVKNIHKDIPFIFEKDFKLIEVACQFEIDYLALSFVRTPEDIGEVKKLLSKDIQLISKIETAQAIENLDSILKEVDSILIDRGDLSTDINILHLAAIQEEVINRWS